jgi:hypothetical protein
MKKLFIVICILLFAILVFTNKRENFKCSCARSNYDIQYQLLNEPLLFNKYGEKSCNCVDPNDKKYDPIVPNPGPRITKQDLKDIETYMNGTGKDGYGAGNFFCNNESPDGYSMYLDGASITTQPKRDVYLQGNGRLGDDTLSGYNYYSAI